MLYPEFKEYLEENTNSYDLFREKSLISEQAKNKKRQPAKRWNDAKINKAVQDSWKQVSMSAYNQIKPHVGTHIVNERKKWLEFMEQHNFIEMFEEGIAEMEL